MSLTVLSFDDRRRLHYGKRDFESLANIPFHLPLIERFRHDLFDLGHLKGVRPGERFQAAELEKKGANIRSKSLRLFG